MNLINTFKITFYSFFWRQSPKILLGRWNLDYDNKIDYKVKWANEDNCGVCDYKKDYEKES
jgi:hypothetical protein